MKSTAISRKIITSVTAGLVLSALLLMLGNGGNVPFLPPVLVFSLVGISMIIAIIFPFYWQFQEKLQKIDSDKIYTILLAIIRFSIAFNIASFGWKKIFDLQFVVPPEIAKLPMNEQSGEWLTWYYFGHSMAFGLIISFTQIFGAILLLYKRTLLLGAIILFALMLNLTLINIFYQMNEGATIQAFILTFGIVFLIFQYYKRLVDFFLKSKPNWPSLNLFNTNIMTIIKISAIVVSFLFTYYLKTLVN